MSRYRNRKLFAVAIAGLTVAALAVPLSGLSTAGHPDGSCLDLHPETSPSGQERRIGETHTIVATIRTIVPPSTTSPATCSGAPVDPTADIIIHFEFISGPNDPDGADTPSFPDGQCTIASGQTQAECVFSYPANNPGTDLIRGWVDENRNANDPEHDPNEGRNENDAPGTGDRACIADAISPPEPDCTDVVSRTTVATGPTLDCDDSGAPDTEREVNPGDGSPASNEVYTCTALNARGEPQAVDVRGENETPVNDPDPPPEGPSYNTPDYGCRTSGTTGQCTITVTQGERELGTATICFWRTDELPTDADVAAACGEAGEPTGEAQARSGSDTGNDAADQVEKTWSVSRAAGLDAEPETDTNNTGQAHTVTATVYEQSGQEFAANTTVNFEFFQGSPADTDGTTPESPDRTCNTPQNQSSCSIVYTSQNTGTDQICVWINERPNMSGNNQSGTCDGEGLNDPDDQAGQPDPPQEPAEDDVDVVQKTWIGQAAPSRLDCIPETAQNQTGTAHTITCTATNNQGAATQGANIDMEARGANDPDGTDSPTSPDFTCTTDGNGRCSMQHGGQTGTATNLSGVTTYTAWIDDDNNNGSPDFDANEGRDEGTRPGNQEPDDTDVVEKTWGQGASRLTISPRTDSAEVGTCNAFTITATDAQGRGVPGVVIDAEQRHDRAGNATQNDEPRVTFCVPGANEGPNPSDVDQTRGDLRPPEENPDNVGTAGGETFAATDASGRVTIGIRVEPANAADGTGNVALRVFIDSQDNDDPDVGEPEDTATKTWTITPRAFRLELTPPEATNRTGQEHTFVARVTDSQGRPVSNADVLWDEIGPGQFSSRQDRTDSNGEARAVVNSSDTGDQNITATTRPCVQGGTCSDTSVKHWTDQDIARCDIEGTEGDDVLTGTSASEVICALGGDDTVDGGGGDDTIVGAKGSDIIDGGDGNDDLDGGGGKDTIRGGAGNDTIFGGSFNDILLGNAGKDRMSGSGGRDTLRGGSDDDRLIGGDGPDILRGGGGQDALLGRGGSDTLRGGSSRDNLQGGRGNDRLNGGRGRDRCSGGPGRDRERNCER